MAARYLGAQTRGNATSGALCRRTAFNGVRSLPRPPSDLRCRDSNALRRHETDSANNAAPNRFPHGNHANRTPSLLAAYFSLCLASKLLPNCIDPTQSRAIAASRNLRFAAAFAVVSAAVAPTAHDSTMSGPLKPAFFNRPKIAAKSTFPCPN